MSGKLIVRLVDAALAGKTEQVKVIANILSSELRLTDPEASKQIAKLTGTALRSLPEKNNPHSLKSVGESQLFFSSKKNDNELNELTLSDKNIDALEQIVKEHNNVIKLAKHKLEPVKTIMFKGPPGVGKTLTAEWLSKKLNLPIKIINLASVMSSLLGQSGNNLSSVFKEAVSSPCILLLDEFDALAKKRDDERDVGELKRLVTVLLQAIDSWPCTSILIAATNHAELLDPAVWRRFEVKLDFNYPEETEIKEYLFKLMGNRELDDLSGLFVGMSYSEIKNEIILCQKAVVLDNKDFVSQLVVSLLRVKNQECFTLEQKKDMAVRLIKAKFSQRKVSELLGISRPTVKKTLS